VNPAAPITEIRGIVRSDSGQPIAGALVMGADLAFVETGESGSYILKHPELALFFWCGGYYPRTHVLTRGDSHVDIVLKEVKMNSSLVS
jgi:hypothetical protein